MQRTITLLIVTLSATILAPAAVAQRYPVCGAWQNNWSLEEGPEAFYIFARQSEQNAAWAYAAQAQADTDQAVALYRQAALAIERGIADQTASAQILEAGGHLREARSARAIRSRYRQQADTYWQAVHQAGGSTDFAGSGRAFACESYPDGDATRWSAIALGSLEQAEQLLDKLITTFESAAHPDARGETARSLEQRINEHVRQGAEALVRSGCFDAEGGLESLLEASFCYEAIARELETGTLQPEIFVTNAAVLRTIAQRLELASKK